MEKPADTKESVTSADTTNTKTGTPTKQDKIQDNSECNQKPKALKSKKRKKPKDTTAPRVPLTGNTCFLVSDLYGFSDL